MDLDFVVIGAGAVAAVVLSPAALPVGVTIGTVLLIGGVAYAITRIEIGQPQPATVPAYISRPGEVQATQVAGGTTLTTPGQISVPMYHAATSIAGEIETLNGKTRAEADALLRARGATKKVTAGGYTHYRLPDGSEIVIRLDGEVIRLEKPVYGPNGVRINKGQRLGPNGERLPRSAPGSHNTGERVVD